MSKNEIFAFTSEWLGRERVGVCGGYLMDTANLRGFFWNSADTTLSVTASKYSPKEGWKKPEGEICVRDWNGYRP
jgi:hypothetical protein